MSIPICSVVYTRAANYRSLIPQKVNAGEEGSSRRTSFRSCHLCARTVSFLWHNNHITLNGTAERNIADGKMDRTRASNESEKSKQCTQSAVTTTASFIDHADKSSVEESIIWQSWLSASEKIMRGCSWIRAGRNCLERRNIRSVAHTPDDPRAGLLGV
jgi:hypothetical protein